jgi:F0F1-type ATP synthase assembly protein I
MRPERESHEQERSAPGVWLARLSGVLAILPASMAAGWIIGFYLVDNYLGTFPWASILLTLAGAGAGFYEIIRILVPRNGDDKHPS